MTSDDRSRQQINQTRATNQAQHRARVQQRQRNPVPTRIGERDSRSGNHAAVYPDGSSTPGGQKLSDGVTKPNEAAVAYPKPSGTVGLDTPRAKDRDTQPLRDRCVGYLRGQLFSCVEEEKDPPGNLKYLFSVESDEGLLIYAGGWRRESVLIKRLAGAFLFHASIDNLGGDKYVVNLGYTTIAGSTHTVEYMSSSSEEGWSLTVPTACACHGHGFWTNNIYNAGSGWQRLKVFQNALTVLPQDDPVFVGSDSASIVTWLLPELEYTNSAAQTVIPNVDPTLSDNGTYSQVYIDSPYRIDPTGKQAAGYGFSISSFSDWVLPAGAAFEVNQGRLILNRQNYWADQSGVAIRTYRVETEVDHPDVAPSYDYDSFRDDNPYIDVQTRTFTSISPKSLEHIKTQDERASVQIYKSNFSKAGTRDVLTYKVDRTGINYTFYNASVKLPGAI